MYKAVSRILAELAQLVPQTDKNGKVLYYFCGSPVGTLLEIDCKCEYLGIGSVESSKATRTTNGAFFEYPKRVYHDLDLVTTEKNIKDYFPPLFVPNTPNWQSIFKPRIAFVKKRNIYGIKTDNLYQWAGFFDIIKYTNEYLQEPLFFLTPESLFAYKVFEICYNEKHLKDVLCMWKTKTANFDFTRAKEIIKRNVTFYACLTEFTTVLSLIKKFNLEVDVPLSPLLDIFDNTDISSSFLHASIVSKKAQEATYSKIIPEFLNEYKSRLGSELSTKT